MDLRVLLFLIFLVLNVTCFEWPAIPYQLTQSCRANQSFDSSTFQCLNCPTNAVPTQDGKVNLLTFFSDLLKN